MSHSCIHPTPSCCLLNCLLAKNGNTKQFFLDHGLRKGGPGCKVCSLVAASMIQFGIYPSPLSFPRTNALLFGSFAASFLRTFFPSFSPFPIFFKHYTQSIHRVQKYKHEAVVDRVNYRFSGNCYDRNHIGGDDHR